MKYKHKQLGGCMAKAKQTSAKTTTTFDKTLQKELESLRAKVAQLEAKVGEQKKVPSASSKGASGYFLDGNRRRVLVEDGLIKNLGA